MEGIVARKPRQVAESDPLAIHCERHGVTAYCLVCRHLREGVGLGYWALKPEAEEPSQAWCEACDAVLAEDQGWTDRGDAFAGWTLYCAGCYAEALALYTRRGWCAAGPAPDG